MIFNHGDELTCRLITMMLAVNNVQYYPICFFTEYHFFSPDLPLILSLKKMPMEKLPVSKNEGEAYGLNRLINTWREQINAL